MNNIWKLTSKQKFIGLSYIGMLIFARHLGKRLEPSFELFPLIGVGLSFGAVYFVLYKKSQMKSVDWEWKNYRRGAYCSFVLVACLSVMTIFAFQ
jgi:hypothetical protein